MSMSSGLIVVIVVGIVVIAAVVVLIAIRVRGAKKTDASIGLPPLGALSPDGLDKAHTGPEADAQSEQAARQPDAKSQLNR